MEMGVTLYVKRKYLWIVFLLSHVHLFVGMELWKRGKGVMIEIQLMEMGVVVNVKLRKGIDVIVKVVRVYVEIV